MSATPPTTGQDFVDTVLGGADSIYGLALQWIAEHVQPGEIYPREVLEEWARINGWTPPQENE